MKETSINILASSCQEEFAALVSATDDCVARKVATLLQERFEQWAGNLGAFQKSKSPLSLEYRLRDAASVCHHISDVLKRLLDSLHAATQIATGKRQNRITSGCFIDESIDISEFDISSSESDDSSSEGEMLIQVSELGTLTAAIKQGVDSLFKASIFVRKFAPKDRRLRAAERTKPFDSRADIMRINEKERVLVEKNPALASRLGEANARRRQYFKYRRDHHDRLASVEVEINADAPRESLEFIRHGEIKDEQSRRSEMTKPSLLADTKATTFMFEDSDMTAALQVHESQPAVSVTSFATYVDEPTAAELQFPPIPPEAQEGSPFLCPYCVLVVQLKRGDPEDQWRKHVIADLEPYICTYPSCTLDTFNSQNAWFEHELLVHRSQWTCPRCSLDFDVPDHLKTHIEQKHQDSFSSGQVCTAVESSKRLRKHIAISECPFCDHSWASAESKSSADPPTDNLLVNIKQFQRHLGHHLQQIALFALPRTGHLPDESQLGSSISEDVPGAYAQVAVLIVEWAEHLDQLGTQSEVDRLEALFRTGFHYKTEIISLWGQSPVHQLHRSVSEFLEEYDTPNNLLIVYYSGHSQWNERTNMLELSVNRDTPFVPWNVVDTLLEGKCSADTLTVLDVAYASNASEASGRPNTEAAGRPTPVVTDNNAGVDTPRDHTTGTEYGNVTRRTSHSSRAYHLLAACGYNRLTAGPGVKSFTSALIASLEQVLESNTPSTIWELMSRINKMKYRRENPAQLHDLLGTHNRQILLAPLVKGKGIDREQQRLDPQYREPQNPRLLAPPPFVVSCAQRWLRMTRKRKGLPIHNREPTHNRALKPRSQDLNPENPRLLGPAMHVLYAQRWLRIVRANITPSAHK